MVNIANLVYYILNVGLKLTLSTGALFNPTFQERTHAVYDIVQQESAKYEPNFEYSVTEWNKTFKLKEGVDNGKDIRR